MKGNMKFGVIVGKKRAEVHEHEIPQLEESDEVLINNKACNICTYDYQQWQGFRSHQPIPTVWGHENAGIVVEIGERVKNIKVGDHIVENIYRPCLECSNCRKGINMNLCEIQDSHYKGKDKYGYYGPYGCAQYKVVPSKHIFKISKDLPFEEAGFCEPLATVLSGIHRLRIKGGENILVVGAGTMGLLNAQVARYYGAKVIVSELLEKKRNTAKEIGFKKVLDPLKEDFEKTLKEITNGQGPDAMIVAVGATKAYKQVFNIAPIQCRILIFAASFPEPEWDITPNLVHYKLWEIIGAYGSTLKAYQESADLLNRRELKISPLIERKFPLCDIQEAFKKASTPGNFRVSIIIPD
jgi:L-iditol 2-dehydrogenase